MNDSMIVRIERGMLQGLRPRKAGCNARLGEHGSTVRVPIVRLTLSDGTSGFGFSRAPQEVASRLLGARIDDLFTAWDGATAAGKPIEYALWDLSCKRAGLPVYAAAAMATGRAAPSAPFSVPCYDTSLYFDDLALTDTGAAAGWMAGEARAGWQRGHRAFKIKIGRGARHMPLEEGMARDIAIVRAVRAEVGPAVPLMVDVNNGYNLNLAKRFLSETADCNLYWLEEAFHEDAVLYRDLRQWMQTQGLQVLIADGEGDASSNLMDWARERLIDAVQRDIISWGFSQLLALAKQLAEWGCLDAPHHYGTGYGNYASCHLGATPGFAFVEWDEAAIAGISAPGYAISNGRVSVPDAPGFGLVLDEPVFAAAVSQDGFTLIR